MENQNVKRGRGRPPKHLTEEERKEAIRQSKKNYMAKKRAENQHLIKERKKPSGRPKKLTDEERKKAITKTKTKYMLNKEWHCDICNTGLNYKLAGKHCHIKSNKHIRNSIERILTEKINIMANND